MTENLPDEELNVVGGEQEAPIDSIAPEAYDPVLEGQPDDYAEAAENNPDRWQEDPLLQDEPGSGAALEDENGVAVIGEEGALSDQVLRDETAEARYEQGDEQYPTAEPRLGEAVADVDFGMMDDDVDASDDPANRGGAPVNTLDVEDLR